MKKKHAGALLRCQLVIAICAIGLLCRFAEADDLTQVGMETDERGVQVHKVKSSRQSTETKISVIVPKIAAKQTCRTLYVLPVEKLDEQSWGDSVGEFLKHDLANKFNLVCVFPTFSKLPWYADHPEDKLSQQESYFVKDVVPFVERTYRVVKNRRGRFLIGFSKSGWGAFSLLLRHPNTFERAAGWDAPMMMTESGKYGSGPIFGTQENFEKYQVTKLLKQKRFHLQASSRLILTGYAGNFRQEHIALHEYMESLQISHIYRDGPQRKHHWETGWVAETLELMMR